VVVLLPKDVQQVVMKPVDDEEIPRILDAPEPLREEARVKIKQLVQQWRTDDPPLIVAGPQVAHFRLQHDVEDLCRRLGAYCATTPDGKWSFPTQSPYYLGTIGIMGHESVARQLATVRQVVVLGGHLGQMCNMSSLDDTSEIVYLGLEQPRSALPWRSALHGDLRSLLGELKLELNRMGDEKPTFLPAGRVLFRESARNRVETDTVDAPWVLQTIQPKASTMDVFVDAGNTGAYCLHYLTGNDAHVFYTALAMGGMGQSFGASIGSAVATQRPTLVISGDGAYLLAGGEIHTAVNHRLPILFTIFNNRSHAMCDLREQLYLGHSSRDNLFMACSIGTGLAAMYPGLPAFDVSSKTEFESVWEHVDDYLAKGPMVISVNLSNDDLPPFAPFLQQQEHLEMTAKGNGYTMLREAPRLSPA
jgi:acetolactate synthase-1/2/3 large subunit